MKVPDRNPGAEEKLQLRSLRPYYVEAEHGIYVSLLMKDITGGAPSQNLAVSGAYGSGKSSVLEGLLGKLKDEGVKAIQVSLATLNQSREALLEVSGETTLTSALEKEVVKRLLYSAKPTEIPRSRFNRIGGFRPWPAAGLSAVTGTLVVGASETLGGTLPAAQYVAAHHWWGWTAPTLDLLSVGVLAFAAQAALSSFRLSEIAVGPAKLSLDDKNGNYFDHFLDEIIYFFQQTKTRVVLFEDLDRFNDPGIFLALRELNNLLNSSRQIDQAVTFVHAIRDSLFVRAIGMPGEHAEASLPDSHARHGADTAASDRAKFFDLIVPVVPFISHEVAADLLLGALGDLPDHLQPSRALVGLAGRNFTDMRVILSIRNEYEVFASELLTKSAVRGLTADQLFAMVIYKHVHLDDFERIRTGASQLDAAVDSIRKSVADMVAAADTAIAETENLIEIGAAADERAKAAGERLLVQLDLGLKFRGWQGVQTVTIDGTKAFPRADVPSRQFWAAIAEAEAPKLHLQTPNGGIEVQAEEVATLLGSDRNAKAWTRSQPQRDSRRLAALTNARTWLLTSPFSALLAGPFPAVRVDASWEWTEIADVCRKALGDGLPYELMRSGHLDQNFALYTTKFHGEMLSAEARSFMMQYVDRHRSEPLFALSASDVDEILDRLGDSLLDDSSALNVAIVDRLIETTALRLPAQVEMTSQGSDFLATYLANGRFGSELLLRVTPLRGDVLDVVASAAGISDADRRRALGVCLTVLSPDVTYSVSTGTANLLQQAIEEPAVLRVQVEPKAAAAIAALLTSNDLKLTYITQVLEPLRSELASSGCFVISRANLEALATEPGHVGLDSIGGLSDGVGRYLIGNLSDYIAAVRADPVASAVDEPGQLDAVVRAIVEYDAALLAPALGALRDGVVYSNLADAPDVAYGDLARARAFAVTRANVAHYVASVGNIDAALGEMLTAAQEIAVPDEDEETARQQLAVQILTSQTVASAAKVPLVRSLKTKNTLDVASLHLTDPALAADLLVAGEIADDASTFADLANCPWPVFEACAARSSGLRRFVGELTFTDDLLAKVLAANAIPAEAQKSLLIRFDSLQPVLATQSATAWLAAATRSRSPLTPPQLIALAEAGADTGQLVEWLKSGKLRLTATDLVAVLSHCATPYSGLATANGATFTVPHSDSFRQVLQTLKSGGVVKAFRKKRLSDRFEVQMVG